MAYSDLREFIKAFEKAGELKRIPFEVDTNLEITEFADRSVKSCGPALLFEKPLACRVKGQTTEIANRKRTGTDDSGVLDIYFWGCEGGSE